MQGPHHPVADLLGGLRPGDDVEVALVEARELLGRQGAVLVVGEPLALAEVELPQPRVVRRRLPARGQDRLRGVPGAGEVAAPHDVGCQGSHRRGDGGRLGATDVVEVDVELALDAARVVVGGPAVSQQHEAPTVPAPVTQVGHVAHERVTSSGRAMAGQSRHSRSRA